MQMNYNYFYKLTISAHTNNKSRSIECKIAKYFALSEKGEYIGDKSKTEKRRKGEE